MSQQKRPNKNRKKYIILCKNLVSANEVFQKSMNNVVILTITFSCFQNFINEIYKIDDTIIKNYAF